VEYKFPRIKIDWLSAGVLLIPSSVELVNDRYVANFANSSNQWKARAAVLTNKKEENFDQIYAHNLVYRSGARINRQNIKIFIS
jgi:hypothetical protein